jgi:hypothetical protein
MNSQNAKLRFAIKSMTNNITKPGQTWLFYMNKKLLAAIIAILSTTTHAKGRPKINIHPVANDSAASWTINAELDQYTNTSYINAGLTYSTPSGWDIGIQSQNIPIWIADWGPQAQNLQDDTFLTINRTIDLGRFNLVIGTQNGYQFYTYSPPQPGTPGKLQIFDYLDASYQLTDTIKAHIGAYYANATLTTTTSYIGEIGGASINFEGGYKLMVDTFSGQSNVSGTQATMHWIDGGLDVYIGGFAPAHNSGNYWYGLVGVSLSTLPIK